MIARQAEELDAGLENIVEESAGTQFCLAASPKSFH